MTFDELVQELFDRGSAYLDEDASSQARAERWINQSYLEILSLYAWPFLQVFTTGTAGAGTASANDIRRVLFVTDISNNDGSHPGVPLDRTIREDLVDSGYDLSQTGTPEVYYFDRDGTVTAFPLGGRLRVDYIKRGQALDGTEEPIFDESYHNLIVDRAMIKVYLDSDNFDQAGALREEFNAGVAAMAEDYMLDSRQVVYLEPSGTDW
jgi:hypothetical protein